MKNTGIVRKVDKLGRIVIPKELRDTLGLNSDDMMEIYVNDNNDIVIRKYEDQCALCDSTEHLHQIHNKFLCEKCLSRVSNIRL